MNKRIILHIPVVISLLLLAFISFEIISNAFGIIFMTSKLKNFDSDQKSNVKKISDIKKIKITGGKNG